MGQEYIAGIVHPPHAIGPHFVDSQLGSAPKSVFEGPEDAVGIVPVAFKLQYGIHHMLQYFRACNTSVFGDMANQEYRNIHVFGKALEFRSSLADLRYAS